MTGGEMTTASTTPIHPPFTGKVALVVGASRGIGAVTAGAFAQAGASVVLASRNQQALEEVAEGIHKDGGQALPVPTDAGDADSVERLVRRAEDTFGRLDFAFNNATDGPMPAPLAALDYADQGIRVNALAPGPILTHHLEAAGEEAQRQASLSTPMRRVGSSKEVADTVLWLCSGQSSFVTGIVVPVDGGQSAGVKPPQMYRQGRPMEPDQS